MLMQETAVLWGILQLCCLARIRRQVEELLGRVPCVENVFHVAIRQSAPVVRHVVHLTMFQVQPLAPAPAAARAAVGGLRKAQEACGHQQRKACEGAARKHSGKFSFTYTFSALHWHNGKIGGNHEECASAKNVGMRTGVCVSCAVCLSRWGEKMGYSLSPSIE